MQYQAPQVPVHLTMAGDDDFGLPADPFSSSSSTTRSLLSTKKSRVATEIDDEQLDERELTHKFADIAQHKHSIRVC